MKNLRRPFPFARWIDKAGWLLALVAIVWTNGSALSDEMLEEAFGLKWRTPLSDIQHRDAESEGTVTAAELTAVRTFADARQVMGFFCEGDGLQMISVVTARYDKRKVLARFNRIAEDTAKMLGPAESGDASIGTAYWPGRVSVEAYPASKTKFVVTAQYRGPDFEACRAANESVFGKE